MLSLESRRIPLEVDIHPCLLIIQILILFTSYYKFIVYLLFTSHGTIAFMNGLFLWSPNHLSKLAKHSVCARFSFYLFNSEIRVGRDDGTTRKVDSFSRKISTKTTLFSLQTLNKTARELFRGLVCRNARQLTVKVKRTLKLQKVPVILKKCKS